MEAILKEMEMQEHFDEDKLIAKIPLPGKMRRIKTISGNVDTIKSCR
jgi:hypothetical protein